MARFFSRLSYSFGNEDWRTEQQALSIQPQDQVLCVTASGDRPLNLLVCDCQKIICVDANPNQNYLLQLKMAAMHALEYEKYLSFLGAASPIQKRERRHLLQRILPYMDEEASQFWLKHEAMVEKGVLYQGATERLTKIIATCARLIRGKKVDRLFAMDNLEEQIKFVREEWTSRFWRHFFNIVLNPLFSHFFLEDPGLANVGKSLNPGIYIYDRINASLEKGLARHNPLLSLMLKGKVFAEAFSPHLTEEGTRMIKTRLQRLNIYTMDIVDYLESLPGPTFDVFSLSDVASYLNHSRFVTLLKAMIKTAKPGARFCLRQFLSSHEIPVDLQPFFVRNRVLEDQLEQNDSCFVYRFFVGKVGRMASVQPQDFVSKQKENYLVTC